MNKYGFHQTKIIKKKVKIKEFLCLKAMKRNMINKVEKYYLVINKKDDKINIYQTILMLFKNVEINKRPKIKYCWKKYYICIRVFFIND